MAAEGPIGADGHPLPAVDPIPPVAAVALPWDAAAPGPIDPVAGLAAARRRHGDTFVVDGYDLEPRFGSVGPHLEQLGGVARAAVPCPVAYRHR